MGRPEESLAQRTRRLLSELELRPKRSRGQSFLIDPSLTQRIADVVCLDGEPQVLEIGAGLGALTDALAERAKSVVAVEIDAGLVEGLRQAGAPRANVRVVQADALKSDLADLCEGPPSQWRIAGSLPYNVATAIVLRALQTMPPFERAVFMVQREVGERLLAAPGSAAYGSLSVATAYYTTSRRAEFRVPRGAFHPQPKVDSTVIAMHPRYEPRGDVRDEALLFSVVRAGFGKRRKQLANALSSAPEWLDASRDAAAEALRECGLNQRARAQDLALDEFVALAGALSGSGVKTSAPA